MSVPKTCIIGARGFIGNALFHAYHTYYPDLIGSDYRCNPSFVKIDLSNFTTINHLNLAHYTYAIVAAGYANIALCEKDPQLAYQINVKGTMKLVEQFIDRNIVPILFSTDYVFDGETGAYNETASINPLNEYGKQKAELEQLLEKKIPGNYILIRLSKVYGLKKGDGTLIDQMIQSLLAKIPIRAAYDQVFSPVSVNDVVNVIIRLQTSNARGVYHVCGPEAWNRFDLAQFICKEIGGDKELVIPISLNDLNEPFFRPKKTDMICGKIKDLPMKSLRSAVHILIQQYYEEK